MEDNQLPIDFHGGTAEGISGELLNVCMLYTKCWQA
jgi:hypothetical protein